MTWRRTGCCVQTFKRLMKRIQKTRESVCKKAQNSDVKGMHDAKKDAKQTRISALGVSLGRKVRKAPGGIRRSSFTWSHAKLVRSTQLSSKSWLGLIPLGRGNPDFVSNSVQLAVYTAFANKIDTFSLSGLIIWSLSKNNMSSHT